ncbi:MAG: HAD-IA family hydrolase [Myxococcota bacterium]
MTVEIARPRLILFDFVGTLAEVRGGVGAAYARYARGQGAEVDAGLLEQGFRAAFKAIYLAEASLPADSAAARDAWHRIIAATFAHAGAPDLGPRLASGLYAWFATAEPWHVYPEVPAALGALNDAGIPLAILSNFDDRLPGLLEALDLAKHFDSITIPEHAGAPKPAPAIFRHALARHDVAPTEAWMVGDSEPEDIHPAQTLGLQTFQIVRHGHAKPTPAQTYPTLAEVVRLATEPPPRSPGAR